ncbi:unnamed protein product, partial [Mesorhabditis spiculigera]
MVLCESAWPARVAAEVLNDIARITNSTDNTIAIIRLDLPMAQRVVDELAGCLPQFVVSVDRRSLSLLPLHTTEHVALLSERYEKLRATDGRREHEFTADNFNFRVEPPTVLDTYNFDFHPSALCLDVKAMRVTEYFSLADESSPTADFRLGSNERTAYARDNPGATFYVTGARPRIGVLDDDQLFWNETEHSLYGRVPTGELSKLLIRHISTQKVALIKPLYDYVEDPAAVARRKQIDQLISRLDTTFPFLTA